MNDTPVAHYADLVNKLGPPDVTLRLSHKRYTPSDVNREISRFTSETDNYILWFCCDEQADKSKACIWHT